MFKEKEILLELLSGLIPLWNNAEKLIALINNVELDTEFLIELISIIEEDTKGLLSIETQNKLITVKEALIQMREKEQQEKDEEGLDIEKDWDSI